MNEIPTGWREVKSATVYVHSDTGRITVTANVAEVFGDIYDDDEHPHNCDQMGCGSAAPHVVHRGQLASLEPEVRCTGVTARWCPVHGDCVCDTEGSWEYGCCHLDNPLCPLHGDASNHAEALA